MLGLRPSRFLRRHYRLALVWAAMPLAVFNSRTLVGCGCFGHFEAVCQCACCGEIQGGGRQQSKSASSCCTGHSLSTANCSHCNTTASTNPCNTADGNSSPDNGGQSLQGHHCKSFVLHEVTPVTVAPTVNAGDLHVSVFALADVSLPLSISQSQAGQVVDFDPGRPPNDLVVIFHRLVI